MSKTKMKKVGLTGVMGAGKSSVIEILKEKAIPVLDCDRINEALLQVDHAGYLGLVATFSDQILNDQKQLDKQKMSDMIFCDPIKKQRAEAILHPLIKTEIENKMAALTQYPLVVVEVPLLFEIHWESYFDEIWVVASEESILLERLSKFRHVSKEEAKRRLAVQMPQQEKIARADVVLWNNEDKEALRKQIIALL
ncbi:dephospho-CoA kinase [[Eubacterium] hominis]|uniref:dephospho-CoA kinase n=1 Tax=[Eubacterium] hominis TaxID=2764325 RepID=UPI003A4D6452